ncbi:MAG: hypothetical protein K2H09_09895 [Treponemataceae bacterium]|nr:hypothetical protein [Treponemataceae bacterium]
MKRTNFLIDEIPELVRTGTITAKQGLNLLAEEIHRFPGAYGIPKNDEELRSELSLHLLQNGFFLFDHYDRKYGNFRTYFLSFIRYQIMSIERTHCKQAMKSQTVANIEIGEYEGRQAQYNDDEFACRLLRFKPYFPTARDKAPYSAGRTRKPRQPSQPVSGSSARSLLAACRRKTTRSQKTALVVALKSSCYLTDDHIRAVSAYCDVPEDELLRIVEKLKETVRRRSRKVARLQELRDYSFFQHQKYQQRLEFFRANNLPDEEARRLYEFHTKKWNNRNEQLKGRSSRVCPTNKTIADILGICERQVGYYIRQADELADIELTEENGTER